MSLFRFWLIVVVLVLAGCSGSSSDQEASAASTTSSAVAEEQAEPAQVDESAEPAAAVDEDEAPDDSEDPPPAEPYDPDAQPATDIETDPTTAWISRRSMSAESVEVGWSAPEGAADYQVHRVIWEDRAEPDGAMMTPDNLLTTGDYRGGFVDDDVAAGEEYWYGVRGLDSDGNVLSVGWHWVAAVTDEQPPAQVELAVEQDADSVLLSWSEPDENFRMHGYRVFRAIGDSEPEFLVSTWDLDQTSFLDPDPPSGTVTYSVLAFDFHWNESEPAEITIDIS